jgi:phenylacetate-CoA ligase
MPREEHQVELLSEIPELGWPASPGRRAAELLALLYQLERTEWWSPERLRRRQLQQFDTLVRYATTHSDWYRERLAGHLPPLGAAWDEARFSALPLLKRLDLARDRPSVHSKLLPQTHGPTVTVHTSGSTGQPVSVRRTAVTRLMWAALNMRDHLWHRRDFSKTLAIIRAAAVAKPDDGPSADGWGEPASLLVETGPRHVLPLDTDLELQVRWLLALNPGYLLTYATNLAGLLDSFERLGTRPSGLLEVRNVGETLRDGLRERCRDALGARLVDSYSSQELGAIALECPVSGLYHVHAESVLVEVLDSHGMPVPAGAAGRVVVTDLHNFATPLIRYELGDLAEPGPPCPCGRGLPTLERILGRTRNMVVLPSGERHWPLVGFAHYREIADILQYQLVQHSLEDIEMRLVTGGAALTPTQEGDLARVVQKSLRHPFHVRFTRFESELPGTRSGKFEEFVTSVE